MPGVDRRDGGACADCGQAIVRGGFAAFLQDKFQEGLVVQDPDGDALGLRFDVLTERKGALDDLPLTVLGCASGDSVPTSEVIAGGLPTDQASGRCSQPACRQRQ